MKDPKLSSKYDNHICTLENGEKLFSAEVAIYKKYLNPKRKTNTYKTRDLILINRLINELRIHIKMYLHSHHGLKKENK